MLQNLKVTPETPVTTTGNYRWVVCGLLFFATTVNYMDRQILSLIKPILDNQLHWSNEQFGAVNSAFQGAYAVGGLIFGWLVDRLGSKIGYAISITGWSVAAIGHAFVTSVGGLKLRANPRTYCHPVDCAHLGLANGVHRGGRRRVYLVGFLDSALPGAGTAEAP